MSLVANFERFQAAKTKVDVSAALWARLRQEAAEAYSQERALGALFVNSILNRASFEDAVIHRIAARLGNEIVPAFLIADVFAQALAGDAGISAGFLADIMAVVDRDPACERLLEPFLYFKGFHAIETHRLAHWLWANGRTSFALYLQSRSSEVFQTDIHPAAVFGQVFSWITRRDSSSARQAPSVTTFRSSRMYLSAALATRPATGTRKSGAAS